MGRLASQPSLRLEILKDNILKDNVSLQNAHAGSCC